MKSCGAGVGDPAGTLRIGGKVKKEGSAVNKRMLLPLFYLSKVSINSYPDLVIIYKSPLASIKHKFISSSKPLSHFATSRRSWDVIKSILFSEYDIIFIDECSTIDNQTMKVFLEKLSPDTFLVLAGAIYQIESIDFGNWFFYAKDIIKTRRSKVELLNTWRTDDQSLTSLWDEVRKREPLITEKLVIDGPFSENIGLNVLRREEKE